MNVTAKDQNVHQAIVDSLSPSDSAKLDPYFMVALCTAFSDYFLGAGEKPKVAIGFTTITSTTQDAAYIEHELGNLFPSSGQNRLTNAHLNSLQQTGCAYLTADVSLDLLLKLISASFVTEIQLCANLAPKRRVPRRVADNVSTSKQLQPLRSSKEKILAVIDHGCPFAHRAFLDASKTRVFAIWDQDEIPDFPVAIGSVPIGYGYGRQIGASSLNQFIHDATKQGRIDEDQCYRMAEYPAVRSRFTHGSFNMGLLAGNRMSPSLSASGQSEPFNEALDADIVFVQLPRSVLMAPARGSIDRCTLDGIRYILDCAPDCAHVSVVVDYGTEMGPHNGESWFERALDAMVDQALFQRSIKLNVVFASGNSQNKNRHAVVFVDNVPTGTRAEFGWWAPKGNDAPITAEIWMDVSDSNFTFELIAPGLSTPVVNLGASQDAVQYWPERKIPPCVVVSKQFGQQRQILIQIAPTSQATQSTATHVAGVWTLSFTLSTGRSLGPLYAYTCWGGQQPGLPKRIEPSRFIVGIHQAERVHLTGDGSILGSGCGYKTLMVGGYKKWEPLSRAQYSSGGNARGGRHARNSTSDCVCGADWLAATEESPELAGLLCLGTRSGSLVRARGTSFATPQVARKIITTGSLSLPVIPFPRYPKTGPTNHLPKQEEFGERRVDFL